MNRVERGRAARKEAYKPERARGLPNALPSSHNSQRIFAVIL